MKMWSQNVQPAVTAGNSLKPRHCLRFWLVETTACTVIAWVDHVLKKLLKPVTGGTSSLVRTDSFEISLKSYRNLEFLWDCISVYFSGGIDVFSSWGGTRDSSSVNWSWRWCTRAYIWVFLARKTGSSLLCSQVRRSCRAVHADKSEIGNSFNYLKKKDCLQQPDHSLHRTSKKNQEPRKSKPRWPIVSIDFYYFVSPFSSQL